jgi:pimeloyl-ACP methyl ester carboxylesterase
MPAGLHYITTDGGRLAVELTGKETDPLVICSPGMGDTRDAYEPLAKILVSHGYRVATMDARGHGDSSADFARYGDEATADDFLTVADEFSHGSHVVLAGASFSAAAAMIAAAKQPERISKIVLLGPALRNGMGVVGLWLMPVMFAWPWGPAAWEMFAATLWPGLGTDGTKKRAAASRASLTRPGRWAAFQATIKGLDHRVVAPYISKVRAPVLVVMGDKDPDWTEPLKEADWVASNFSQAETLIVAGAGHAPMFERPEVVAEKMVSFLGDKANVQ